MLDLNEIFVRAHTVLSDSEKKADKRAHKEFTIDKWPAEVLVIDTESTTGVPQKLNFGVYRRCSLTDAGFECFEEGLVYPDDLAPEQLQELQDYITAPDHMPELDVKRFPPPIRLPLFSRSDFIERVFWKAIRKGAMVVGFNLPFDLSQLAAQATASTDGGWSFVMSMRKSRKTGEMEFNPDRPRVVIVAKDSKVSFIRLRAVRYPDEWPKPREGRFLDLHTLVWALRNESYSLKTACEKYGLAPQDCKLDYQATGTITFEEIDYCRRDVRATARLLNAARREFDKHPINLLPDKAYSPASIAKAYLGTMYIESPKSKFDNCDYEIGIAMQAYYGGRAEVRIRRTHVPVVLADFTSQYSTVNALLDNSKVLTAKSVSFEDCTDEIRELVNSVTLDRTFDREFWRKLKFFALVAPDQDIFPVRKVYNGRTQNIGLNHLSSEPLWFAGPDLIASRLLSGKSPRVIRAIRIIPHGQQVGLQATNLFGLVRIDPSSDDFFRHVIEQKSVHKSTNKALATFLKVLGSSGSYGLFVQVDQEKLSKPTSVKVYSGDIEIEKTERSIEKAGPWYFPPLASLITAGGRLLLAMLEKSVAEQGGTYLFCDTDSLCIVSNEEGGLVPCGGGSYSLADGQKAVKALPWKTVHDIAERFNQINPYRDGLVRELLKVEDVNFSENDPKNAQRQLYGYAVSAKRYALYQRDGEDIRVVKASGHGLGYLFPPRGGYNEDADAQNWIVEAWEWQLREDLGLPCTEPDWLELPAFMRITLTSPNVMRHNRPDWLPPFNFFFLPFVSELGGYPAGYSGENARFIAPFCSDRQQWSTLPCVNIFDGENFEVAMTPTETQDKVMPDSFRIILRQYLERPEAKFLAPDGSDCRADTRGLLKRASVVVSRIVPIGKECDRRWEQGDEISLADFQVLEYRETGKMLVADAALQKRIIEHGIRRTIRDTGLSQHTIESVIAGKPVRRKTLERIFRSLRAKASPAAPTALNESTHSAAAESGFDAR